MQIMIFVGIQASGKSTFYHQYFANTHLRINLDMLKHGTVFVVATQNPVESGGTYPLHEAQMDRFAMQFSLGYISVEEEVEILTQHRKGYDPEGITATEREHLKKMIQS